MRETVVRESLAGHEGCLEKAFNALETSDASAIRTLKRDDCTLASARFDLADTASKGYWEFLRLGPDLFAIVCNMQYASPVTVPVVGEDWIEFHFRLSGELKIVEGRESVDVAQGSLLVWRQPRGCDIIEHLSSGSQRETSVTFYCRPSFLRRRFGEAPASLDDGLAAALAERCDGIKALLAVLYPTLSRLIVDFASSNDRSGLQLVKAESLATQIIGEVLMNVPLQDKIDRQRVRVSDRDIECLRSARQLLIARHTPPPTIDEIGRRVGMSGTKLKGGFRQLFGQTIAEYANDLRMEAAKELLRKSDRPIAQVSQELGYEYQNSFTVAFRRKWGILPKDYRRDPLAFDRSPGAAFDCGPGLLAGQSAVQARAAPSACGAMSA